jgi:2-iminobutanoate/2-iminopropanoate deaminase
MKFVLEAGGSSMTNVLKTTVLLENMEDYKEVNAIYSECKFLFLKS